MNALFSPIKGVVAGLLVALNAVVVFSAMIPVSLVKLLVPLAPVQKFTSWLLMKIASRWVSFNTLWMKAVQPKPFVVRGLEGLRPDGWFLVSSNHQSWVDILVLQRIFNGKIPFLKFFLKKELIYVPVMGLAWWALDFPFMQRKGGKAGAKDLATARQACEKFRHTPTSVFNFMEGTRFTRAKHAQQKSPYRHLLKPKTGGATMALEAMGDMFDALLDVTIVYPDGIPTFTDLLCGRVENVVVTVRAVPIPAEFKPSADANAGVDRGRLQEFANAMWRAKDAEITALLAEFPPQRRA